MKWNRGNEDFEELTQNCVSPAAALLSLWWLASYQLPPLSPSSRVQKHLCLCLALLGYALSFLALLALHWPLLALTACYGLAGHGHYFTAVLAAAVAVAAAARFWGGYQEKLGISTLHT